MKIHLNKHLITECMFNSINENSAEFSQMLRSNTVNGGNLTNEQLHTHSVMGNGNDAYIQAMYADRRLKDKALSINANDEKLNLLNRNSRGVIIS